MIRIQSFFQFEPRWYRRGEVRGIVAGYYRAVRSILKDKPHLRKCLTSCKHCRILFFTHPRNAGRKDLGCPFGCRQFQHRQSAIARSVGYYCSPEGKIKKKALNARRNKALLDSSLSCEEEVLPGGKPEVDKTTVCYIQLTTGLIEGRAISLPEVMRMIAGILRQLSIDRDKKSVYFGCGRHNPPP